MTTMRDLMMIVENATPVPSGMVTAWHGASPSLPITKILPFMHLGTLKAAIHRGIRYSSPALYEFHLNVVKPLHCNDGHGEQHSVEGMIEWLETELNLNYDTVDRLLIKSRVDKTRGVPASLAGAKAISAVLRRRGYDFMYYQNAIEDPGSISWIVLDPSHVQLIGRRSLADVQQGEHP